MAKIKFDGSFADCLASFFTLNKIGLFTYARHLLGRPLQPDWDANLETGILFWRHQFTKAMNHNDIERGREIFDSLQTETDDVYDVTVEETSTPNGRWYLSKQIENNVTILYLHGGGYTFHGAVSKRFAAMLAHHCKARLYAPDYRLTPEHPHPAQAEDALAAWHYLTKTTAAKDIIVIGDSAGGHMALTLLQSLKTTKQPQPALCIALCPWTDIGVRGDSFYGNDPYDLVQGWMAKRFGEWLDPENRFGRDELSPIAYDFSGLAPIYVQAGGREVLRDMIYDFAQKQIENGADILFDQWADMPHDFQAYDSLKQSSSEALKRIHLAIKAHSGGIEKLGAIDNMTLLKGGKFNKNQ